MKIVTFIKNRAIYYVIFSCFCFFLYLIIPNSTFMGVLIGLMVSEIQTYFDFQEMHNNELLSKAKIPKASNPEESRNIKFILKRITLYVLVLVVIWFFSNVYLHFTIK